MNVRAEKCNLIAKQFSGTFPSLRLDYCTCILYLLRMVGKVLALNSFWKSVKIIFINILVSEGNFPQQLSITVSQSINQHQQFCLESVLASPEIIAYNLAWRGVSALKSRINCCPACNMHVKRQCAGPPQMTSWRHWQQVSLRPVDNNKSRRYEPQPQPQPQPMTHSASHFTWKRVAKLKQPAAAELAKRRASSWPT